MHTKPLASDGSECRASEVRRGLVERPVSEEIEDKLIDVAEDMWVDSKKSDKVHYDYYSGEPLDEEKV